MAQEILRELDGKVLAPFWRANDPAQGVNVNITAPPKGGGPAVAPQAFDIDFQTDGFCTGGTITQENTAAVSAIQKRPSAGRSGPSPSS